MKHLIIGFFFILTSLSYSQIFEKNGVESLEEFAEKAKPNPDAKLKGDVLETNLWDKLKKTIFSFYKIDGDEPSINGYVFVQLESTKFNRILIDSYLQEGSDANIESVFFANADKDPEKELFIICKWPQKNGNLFQVYCYDNLDLNIKKQKKLTPLRSIDKMFTLEFEGIQDGIKKIAKFNTAVKVKKQLKKILQL